MSIAKIKDILNNANYLTGSNESTSIKIYEERTAFKNKYFNVENSIDFQNTRTFYGRFDLQQNTIIPDIEKMTLLNSNGKQKDDYVFPFVNDAFRDLQSKINEFISNGKLQPNELLPIDAQKSFISFQNKYEESTNQLLDVFYVYIYTRGIIDHILTFKDFINEFINYVTVANIPITMTKFCISSTNIMYSGLAIDTKKQLLDLDILKDIFYQNTNYKTYNSLLASYGFSIDKHIPWRIVFNIDSAIAKNYMSKYNIVDNNDLFNKYFIRTHEVDISVLFELLLNFYNDKLQQYRPYNFQIKTAVTKKGIKSYLKPIQRLKLEEENLYKLIPEISILKLYFYLRLKETGFDLNQQEFDSLMNHMTILYETSGVNGANEFVNNYTKPFISKGANPSLSLTNSVVTEYNKLNVHFRI